jgi:hypothetical protein
MVIGALLGWLFTKEEVCLVCWSGIGLDFSGMYDRHHIRRSAASLTREWLNV